VAAPVALETFLSRYITAMLEPVAPATIAPPAAIPVVQTQVRPAVPVAPLPIEQIDAVPLPPPVVKIEAPVFVAPPVVPAIVSAPPVVVAPAAATSVDVEPIRVDPPAPVVAATPEPAVVAAAPARDINELLKDFDIPGESAASSEASQPAAPSGPRGKAPWMRIAVAGAVVAALGGGGYYASRMMKKAAPPALGSLAVQTNPAGVAVFVDGVARGNTPARLSLNAGSHIVELRGRGVPRVLPVTITAGAEVSQYLELPETPSAGSLLVQSDPAGARVSVDGVEHGRAPVSVADLTPGEHEVVLQADGGPAVKQKVVIQAGVTSSVLAPVTTAAPGPVSGWLTVKSPVDLEIRENNRLLGTSESDRIMLAAGRHEVQFMNDTLGYDETRVITVQPGKVSPISIQLPQGVININASPWAEVWIDNRRAGETPIGNLPVSIGPHEVVFRHPQLGEKRQAVSVTLKAPVRLSVDMK
jgi:PEGA domain-containing protein